MHDAIGNMDSIFSLVEDFALFSLTPEQIRESIGQTIVALPLDVTFTLGIGINLQIFGESSFHRVNRFPLPKTPIISVIVKCSLRWFMQYNIFHGELCHEEAFV